jgi:hypothetical protein
LLDEEYRIYGTVVNTVSTQAVASANTVVSGDPAILLFLLWSVWAWFSDFGWLLPMGVLNAAVPIAAILRWYVRFGRLPLSDAEFAKVRSEMRRSMRLWLVYVIVEANLAVLWWM